MNRTYIHLASKGIEPFTVYTSIKALPQHIAADLLRVVKAYNQQTDEQLTYAKMHKLICSLMSESYMTPDLAWEITHQLIPSCQQSVFNTIVKWCLKHPEHE